jgi:hypothetical protein
VVTVGVSEAQYLALIAVINDLVAAECKSVFEDLSGDDIRRPLSFAVRPL